MQQTPALAGRFALVLSLSCLACRAGSSFLLFGGSRAPQDELVDSVEGARSEMVETQEDFGTAFRLYQRLTTPQAVDLEDLNDDFGDAIESCQERGHELRARVELVRASSDGLFKGWSDELQRYSGDTLRKKSAAMMDETNARTQRVIAALERVESRMEPVLQKLQDYALFFHHNLNARAIATLDDTYKGFDSEFSALNSELSKAGAEISSFLADFDAVPPDAPPPARGK